MANDNTLQDSFLGKLRDNKVAVSVYLVNGIRLQGHIDDFDQYVIILNATGQQMIYKHAVSTLMPSTGGKAEGHH